MASHPTERNDLDPIEFELTDLDTARQALDDLPPGVAEVRRLSPGYWEQRRRPPAPTDRALAGPTLDWIARLPPRTDDESMMLEGALAVQDNSRLTCQISVQSELDGLVVRLPASQL